MSTVAIYVQAFRHVAEEMKVPRALITRHPVGRTLGAPGDVARQREVLLAALALLDNAKNGAAIAEFDKPYRARPTPTTT